MEPAAQAKEESKDAPDNSPQLGQPGGLAAKQSARQRLERERKERAAKAEEERKAAEAAAEAAAAEAVAKAAAEAEAKAEEEKKKAAPSIELGAPGGLAAQAAAKAAAEQREKEEREKEEEARRAQDALPSPAESRARMQKLQESERKAREQLDAKTLEEKVEEEVAKRLAEEKEKQEIAERAAQARERAAAAETARKEEMMMKAAEEARKVAEERAELDQAKAVAEQARRREANRKKMGMTPLEIPDTPTGAAGAGATAAGGSAAPVLDHGMVDHGPAPVLHHIETPTAEEALPTPIQHQFASSAPQVESLHQRYGQWGSPTPADNVPQNLDATFDSLSEMPRTVGGAADTPGDTVSEMWRKMMDSFCMPKMDECLAQVDRNFLQMAMCVVVTGSILLGWVIFWPAEASTEPAQPIQADEQQQPGARVLEPLQVDMAQQLASSTTASALGATQVPAPHTGTILDLFAAPIMGSLTGHNLQEIEEVKHAADCARRCVDYGPSCVSFDFAAMYERCYLGSSRVDPRTADGSGTNGATEFLYYERLHMPGIGSSGHAGSGALHPEAFALMKGAFDDLKEQTQRHAEMVDSHVTELRNTQQRKEEEKATGLDIHSSVVAALHQQVMQQSGAINEHSANINAVVEALQNDLPSLRTMSPKQNCQPGFSGTNCMDMIAAVESPQHVLQLLRTAATKAANMTLVLPAAAEMEFRSATIEFPVERIVGIFGGREASLEASTMAALLNVHKLEVHGSLSEVRLDTLKLLAATTGLYVSVGSGARFSVHSCEVYGEVHFRYAGTVEVHDTLFNKAKTVFALKHHDGGDDQVAVHGVHVHPPILTIEDSEVVEGEMLLNAPEVSHVSITAVTFEQTMLDLRAPPKSHGPHSSTDDAFSKFVMVSCELSHTRGTIGLGGTDVELSDVAVSNHTGPLVVCAPSYRGGGGKLGLHGLALVHNHGINSTHREYLLDLSGCTTRGGTSSSSMPSVSLSGLTFLNNTVGVLNSDAAQTVVEDSSFHGNGRVLPPAIAGKAAKETKETHSLEHSGGLFAFSGAFTLRESRITAHTGGDIAVCNPLGACRVTIEGLALTSAESSYLVHMCTGHSVAVRHSTFSGSVEGGLVKCAIAVASKGGEDAVAKLAADAEKVEARRKPTGSDRWRDDGRCGPFYPAPAAEPGECNPLDEEHFCCSASGWCGSTPEHCECDSCADYSLPEGAVDDSHLLVDESVEYDPEQHRGSPRRFAMAFGIELTEVGVHKVSLTSRAMLETHPLSAVRIEGSYFASNKLGAGLINDRKELEVNGNALPATSSEDITNSRLYNEFKYGATHDGHEL